MVFVYILRYYKQNARQNMMGFTNQKKIKRVEYKGCAKQSTQNSSRWTNIKINPFDVKSDRCINKIIR